MVGAMHVSTVVWLHGGHEDNFALSLRYLTTNNHETGSEILRLPLDCL
jgi:hypothetical protein